MLKIYRDFKSKINKSQRTMVHFISGTGTPSHILRRSNYHHLHPPIVQNKMASLSKQLHFVLIPLMAQGHMIPMIDMVRLLTSRGVIVSLVTTPLNASRFSTIIDRDVNSSGLPIRLVQIPFPCQEVGLPLDCENLDIVPSRDYSETFILD